MGHINIDRYIDIDLAVTDREQKLGPVSSLHLFWMYLAILCIGWPTESFVIGQLLVNSLEANLCVLDRYNFVCVVVFYSVIWEDLQVCVRKMFESQVNMF